MQSQCSMLHAGTSDWAVPISQHHFYAIMRTDHSQSLNLPSLICGYIYGARRLVIAWLVNSCSSLSLYIFLHMYVYMHIWMPLWSHTNIYALDLLVACSILHLLAKFFFFWNNCFQKHQEPDLVVHTSTLEVRFRLFSCVGYGSCNVMQICNICGLTFLIISCLQICSVVDVLYFVGVLSN